MTHHPSPRRAPCAAIILALAAGSAAADGPLKFVERPGALEFSGELIVRPLQPKDLAARGVVGGAAAAHAAGARAALGGNLLRHEPRLDHYTVRVPAGHDESSYANALMATGLFEYAHPNWICYPIGEPNDPLFKDQWHHVNMQSALAWDISTGDLGVIVAVTDTGIDVTHPDLAAHRVPGFNAVSGLAEVDGGDVTDINGHGTHVAGCAAAIRNNAVGVSGIGNFGIMMCRVTDSPGGGAYYEDLFEAAMWAAENGAKVVSASYTGVQSPGVQTTGEYVKSKGALYLYAADNYNQNHSGFDWPDVIVVAATDWADNKAGFSSYGKAIDVAAPGVDILAPVVGGGYQAWSGTSMATPVANGLCALIWSINPSFTPQQVEMFLSLGCDDLGAPGEDDIFGHGRVNSFKSASLALASLGPQPPNAVDDFAKTILPAPITLDVLGNDFDVNGDAIDMAYYDTGSALGGTVTLSEGTGPGGRDELIFTPKSAGIDTFGYMIKDATNQFDSAVVTVTVLDPAKFRDPDATGPTEPGLFTSYYVTKGYSWLPDFDALTPYKTEVVPDIAYESTGGVFAGSGLADEVGAVFEGYVIVPEPDVYTFYTNSDDGSRLWIGGTMVVDNDGLHGMVEKSGEIGLKAGPHRVRVEFWENFGGAGVLASIKGGGMAKAVIPAPMFVHGDGCYADFDASGTLDLFDFFAFVNSFNGADPAADCDGSGGLNLFDFLCFVGAFNEGC